MRDELGQRPIQEAQIAARQQVRCGAFGLHLRRDQKHVEGNIIGAFGLIARIDKTVDYLKSFRPAQIDGSEERSIVVKTSRRDFSFTGLAYLRYWALPNFFFHVTTAYNLLRHNGVEIGKADFLGALDA